MINDYYKQVIDDRITAVGEHGYEIGISKAEYDAILAVMLNPPTPPEGKGYRLKADLSWEEYDLPVIDPDDEMITAEEALRIITGEVDA
jgi:hypothetical protein